MRSSGLKPMVLGAVMLTALGAFSAEAKTERIAVLVANHEGGDTLPELRYAERDAQRFRDVLTDLGGFQTRDIITLIDRHPDDVEGVLSDLKTRVARVHSQGDDVALYFYYSGHAENGVLRLGEARLPMMKLKGWIEATAADVRLAFIDSCGAGAMTRTKGGTQTKGGMVAPPFVVKVEDTLKARGQVIITSSSADEASQESDEIQGSFFTHYLTTAMRGAGDKDGDGRVTLDEAYSYAYQRTVASTANTKSGVQHPTYQYDITGAGNVVLALTKQADVILTFPAELEGNYFVVDADRQLFVAEVDKSAGEASRIGLPAGKYVLKKRLDTHLLMQRLPSRAKGNIVVDESVMEEVAFEDDYAKGTPILSAEIKRADLGFSLSAGMGVQVVADDFATTELPPIGLVNLEARLTNVFTENLSLTLDFGFGSRRHTLQVPELQTSWDLQYTQVQVGSAILFETDLGPLHLAAGPRTALLFTFAQFDGAVRPPQETAFAFAPAPGLMGVVGWSFFDWVHIEAQARANYLPYMPAAKHLAYLELLTSVWIDI